jgi:ATP-dependent 26S proteasome regulatory subunit
MSTKKGILFYGLPGTGKTHTIHYLASVLPQVTTLLITEEQVSLLSEYMALARLLQPSMVVIEDADLIARDRTAMAGPSQEMFLNKLLNEMDGLRTDADILFILTTNRPETLEAALTSRPGRIDQAIEFPLPDAEGRERLIRLYSHEAPVTDNVVRAIIKLTENVSAAFIKELMRRATQFYLERGGSDTIMLHDVDASMEEMMFEGGSLNRKLLGGYRDGEES